MVYFCQLYFFMSHVLSGDPIRIVSIRKTCRLSCKILKALVLKKWWVSTILNEFAITLKTTINTNYQRRGVVVTGFILQSVDMGLSHLSCTFENCSSIS